MSSSAKEMHKKAPEPLPPPTNDKIIKWEATSLLQHMTAKRMFLKENHSLPFILLETAPKSTPCRSVLCINQIASGDYRIAVLPGYHSYDASLFHVKCFESIADFSNLDILIRFEPLTRHNCSLRKIGYRSIVNGGAERLVEEWKRQIWNLHVPQVTSDLEQKLKDSPAFRDMYFHAGSKGYVSSGMPDWLSPLEAALMTTRLRPIESDPRDKDEGEGRVAKEVVESGSWGKKAESNQIGDGISDEWSLFRTYVSVQEGAEARTSLSRMLEAWKQDVKFAVVDEYKLTVEDRIRKEVLGQNGMRAVKRLSAFIELANGTTH